MPTHNDVTSITVTGSTATGWTATIYYTDASGNAKIGESTDSKIVDQAKYIRDKWDNGKTVSFTFDVGADGKITHITTSASPPTGN